MLLLFLRYHLAEAMPPTQMKIVAPGSQDVVEQGLPLKPYEVFVQPNSGVANLRLLKLFLKP